MTETTKRIIELMNKNEDSCHSLEVKAHLPISCVASWKTGRTNPSTESIIKLAKYFNVATDYLLCLSNEPVSLNVIDIVKNKISSIEKNLDNLLEDEQFIELIKIYSKLSQDKRKIVFTYLLGLIAGFGLDKQD